MLTNSATRNSALLAGFAVLTTALIAGTYLGTKTRIADAQRAAELKALAEIVNPSRYNNLLLDDTLPVGPDAIGLGLESDKKIYLARKDGIVQAVILPVRAPDGYSGAIELAVGINRDGSLAGVRALQHRETPGLGDKVDTKKSDWMLDFTGKSLQAPPPESWRVTKDGGVFDTFTGATITPRAVVAAVKRSLDYFEQHRARLLDEASENSEQTLSIAARSLTHAQEHLEALADG
ncbi:MAG: electron transport complex subunit RsxG [Pseudomonadota bacterium]